MEFLTSVIGHRLTIGLRGKIEKGFKLSDETNKLLKETSNITELVFVLRKIEDYNDFPFPKITKIIYETKKVEEFNLNSPIPQGNIESTVCWNTPVYCMAGKFDGINLKKVNNYTIINQN